MKSLFVLCVLFCSTAVYAKVYFLDKSDVEAQWFSMVPNLQHGDEVVFPKGVHSFSRGVTIWNRNVLIRGRGIDKTVLDFSAAKTGAQSVLVKGGNVALKGFSLISGAGDGIVARGLSGFRVSNVGVSWGREHTLNNGYGIYPVLSANIHIENCRVSGAGEAGIYIGQSRDALILNNTVEANTVGVDIENSIGVLVEKNSIRNNSIGILATFRPYLSLKSSKNIMVSLNTILDNNLDKIASGTEVVNAINLGYGVVFVGIKDSDIKKNELAGHKQAGILLLDYDAVSTHYKGDSHFDPKLKNIKVDERLRKEVLLHL